MNAVAATLSMFLTTIIALISIPIAISTSGLAAWGEWLAISALFQWLAAFDFGIQDAVVRQSLDQKGNIHDHERIAGGALVSFMGVASLAFIFVAAWPNLITIFNIDKDEVLYLPCLLFVLGITLNVFNSYVIKAKNVSLDNRTISIAQIISVLLMGFVQLQLLYLGQGILALSVGYLSGVLALNCYVLYYERKLISVNILNIFSYINSNLDNVKKLFIPRLLDNIIRNSSLLILQTFQGAEITAILGTLKRLFELSNRFINIYRSSIMSPAMSIISSQSEKKQALFIEYIAKTFRLFIVSTCILNVIFLIFYIHLSLDASLFLNIELIILLALLTILHAARQWVQDIFVIKDLLTLYQKSMIAMSFAYFVNLMSLLYFNVRVYFIIEVCVLAVFIFYSQRSIRTPMFKGDFVIQIITSMFIIMITLLCYDEENYLWFAPIFGIGIFCFANLWIHKNRLTRPIPNA